MPAILRYSLIIKATVWSVSLCSDNLDPFENLRNRGPFLILDILSHLLIEVTGQYSLFSKCGIPFTSPSPNWSVFDFFTVILSPSNTNSKSSTSNKTSRKTY